MGFRFGWALLGQQGCPPDFCDHGGSGLRLLAAIFISGLKLKLSIHRVASSSAALLKFDTLLLFGNTSANLWRLLKLRRWLADVTRSVSCLYLGLSLLFSGNKEFA